MNLRRRGRLLLVGALAIVAAIAVGVIELSTASADDPPEPSALATSATFTHQGATTLSAQSTRSSIRGAVLHLSHGQGGGTAPTIGGGDEVIAALTGSLSPVAVESADGNAVVYSAWHQLSHPDPGAVGQGLSQGDAIGNPSIRLYNGSTGQDILIASGAYSPALSRDNHIAFVRGDESTVRQNVDYNGQVVVSTLNTATAEAPLSETETQSWTTESARYFIYGWAGSTLIVYKSLPESEAADVYGFTGPDSGRLIAPNALVVAMSPDGTRLLITVERRMVEVVRVADGAVEASMALDGDNVAPDDSSTTPHAIMFSGSWYGDRVAANSDMGLVILNVQDGIHIESIFSTPGFATGITEPILLDDSHVIGWAELGSLPAPNTVNEETAYDNALVACDLTAHSCDVAPASPARSWARWVANPSR